jgi:hypothetical protein
MRFIVNIALKTGMIALLNWFGWIMLLSNGHVATGAKQIVGVAVITAVIFTIVTLVTLVISLGLATFLFIFLGGAILELMHIVAPGFVALNHSFWLNVLSGFLILAASVPRKSTSSSTNQHQRVRTTRR